MIIGIGVEIVEIDRIREGIEQHGERFLERMFTGDEVRQARGSSTEHLQLAAKYAAKEALCKALGGGGGTVGDVEVLEDEQGKTTPYIHGAALEAAERAAVHRFHVSLTHSKSHAVAVVIAEGAPEAAEATLPGDVVEVAADPGPAVDAAGDEEPAAEPEVAAELSDEELLEAADAGWETKASPWQVEAAPAPRRTDPPRSSEAPRRNRPPRRSPPSRGAESAGDRRGPRRGGRRRGRDEASDSPPRERRRDRGMAPGDKPRENGDRSRSRRGSSPGSSGGGRSRTPDRNRRGPAKVSPEVEVEDFFMHGGFQMPLAPSAHKPEVDRGPDDDRKPDREKSRDADRRRSRRPRRASNGEEG